MPEQGRTQPWWERQPGEESGAFERFLLYRNLGPDRTYHDAVRLYLQERPPGAPSTAQAKARQRFLAHANPARYVNGLAASWLQTYAQPWQWAARATAFDDWIHQESESRRIESQIRVRQEEIAEEERQARTRLSQLRVGRSTCAAVLNKLGRAFVPPTQGGTGELVNMPPRDLLLHLGKVGSLLVACIAEERRELAAMAPPPPAETGGPDDSVVQAAHELLQEMQRVASSPLALAALAEECQAGNGANRTEDPEL